MNPLAYLQRKDAEVKARSAKDAGKFGLQIAAERAKRDSDRTKKIQGRSVNEKADMLGSYLADASRMQGEEIASSPIGLRQVMQSAGLPGTGGKGKYTNKGALQAPDLDEAALRSAVMESADGARPIAAALAQQERPGLMEMGLRARQAIAQNMGADGTRGQISRGAAYAGMTGGITASGAALVDLMQFMTQGAEVQSERDDVLPS
tara:strand:- start:536 stop:1153 length:618 start_codon:yes stop_codon:yes gene_type:complete